LPGNAEAIPDPKPEEAKPVVSKPGETKAITTAPGEAKPADAKPVESKAVASKPTEGKVDKDNTLKEPIYLQAGSFASASEADNQKARLALLGAEARIQQVMLQDKVWYRVRIGPYHKMDDVTHLRADLAQTGHRGQRGSQRLRKEETNA
jgi:cell division protein FtsN